MAPDAEAVSAAIERLAHIYRVVDVDDVEMEIPDAPWGVIVDGFRIAHDRRVIYRRNHPPIGYISAIYDGAGA